MEVGAPWTIRVFPNKYPATDAHEVLVESPRHDAGFDDIDDPAAVVRTYVERYAAHASDAGYVSIFKNHGRMAGASMPHIHSQLIAVPFVPPRITREAEAFTRASDCPLCAAIETHRRDGLLIDENGSFVRIAPFASTFAWQQWIVPKRHQPELTSLTHDEIADLGVMLQAAARAMRDIADAFNWLLMNFPRTPAAHFYVDAFPRSTTIAGFELATGTFIEIADPAAAARRLR